jgi:hypothetical protein
VRDEQEAVERPSEVPKSFGQVDEITLDEPYEWLRGMGMPVKQRKQGGAVDGYLVQANAQTRGSFAAPIEHHKTILLADEMEHGCICESTPENRRAHRVEEHADHPAREGRCNQPEREFGPLLCIAVGAVDGAVDVCHVDPNDQRRPRPQ